MQDASGGSTLDGSTTAQSTPQRDFLTIGTRTVTPDEFLKRYLDTERGPQTSAECPYCPGPPRGWAMGPDGWENMKRIHDHYHT